MVRNDVGSDMRGCYRFYGRRGKVAMRAPGVG